jgi:hypothetical protein
VAAVVLLALYLRGVGGELGDFEAYYSAAWTVRHGEPLYEYALAWRDAGIGVNFPGPRPMADRYPSPDSSPFVYPSAFALVFLPATLLPVAYARDIWFTLMFGCAVGTAFVLSRIFFDAPGRFRLAVPLVLALALMLFQPTRASLSNKQVDALLLLMLTLSLLAFVRHQDRRAGLWLALAASVKPFLGFLILFFLWKRAYRTAAITVALAGALFFLPTLHFGPGVLADFVSVAAYWSSPSFAVSPFNQSVYGLALRLFTVNAYTVPIVDAPALPLVIRGIVTVGTLCLLARLISRSRRRPGLEIGLEYGLAIVGMLLVAPLAQDIYYIHLIVPLVAMLAVLKTSWVWQKRTMTLAVVAAGATLYLTLPTLRAVSMAHYAFHQAQVSGLQALQTGAHVCGLLAVAAATLAVVCRARSLHVGCVTTGPATTEDDRAVAR